MPLYYLHRITKCSLELPCLLHIKALDMDFTDKLQYKKTVCLNGSVWTLPSNKWLVMEVNKLH